MCSVGVGGKIPKSVWWNDEVKAVFKRKEVLGAEMKMHKKDVWKFTKKKR